MNTNQDDFLDPTDPHAYERERAKHLSARYGPIDSSWDAQFSQLDTSAAKARKASEELKGIIAANKLDPQRPLVFSVTIANRPVTIQVRQREDGQWTCTMPCEIEAGVYEHRELRSGSYDGLLGMITRQLASALPIRELSAEESLELARMCVQKQNHRDVVFRYLELRLGKPPDETTLSDPRYLNLTNDCALFVFLNSEPTARDSQAFRDFLKDFAAGRPYALPLIRAAWTAFQKASRQQQAEKPPQVSATELEQSTDQELSATFHAVRQAYATAERQRRDLLHNPPPRRTAEQALRDLRGPDPHGIDE